MRKFLLNTVLVLVSVLVTYGVLELACHLVLPRLPASFFNNECRELRTMGQSSKKGVVPQAPYIAILGDSYGAGQGDWFLDNRYDPASRYQAAHVLQDLTGRDVLSLSRAGSGSYDGPAVYAVNTWRYLRGVGFDLPAPQAVVVYFYEGNDVGDNLRFMARHFTPDHDPGTLFDDATFDRFAADMDARYAQGKLPRLQDKFLLGNLASRYVEGLLYAANTHKEPLPPGTRFPILLDGQRVELPDSIECDLTRYTPLELRQAVRFFERALARVAALWPDAERYVVYIPSPQSIYAFQDAGAGARLRAAETLEAAVDRAAAANDCTPIAFSGPLRDLARRVLVNGPRDWNHLNRAGYELLGTVMARALQH